MTEQIQISQTRERQRAVQNHQGRRGLLKIHRHNPGQNGESAGISSYTFPLSRGMTVLDALLWVKEHLDSAPAFRYSCRMGVCGSCGMLINGKPRLACETQIGELGNTIEVAPLPNFPLVRDTVTEFDGFFQHHTQIKPYLIRGDNDADKSPETELRQTEDQVRHYYQFSMCIMCGLCDAACPIYGSDPEFLGPQALAQAYRFAADSRDQGWKEREIVIDTAHGCWDCRLAGSCSAVCPKGVDPDLGIQLLKRSILGSRFGRKVHR